MDECEGVCVYERERACAWMRRRSRRRKKIGEEMEKEKRGRKGTGGTEEREQNSMSFHPSDGHLDLSCFFVTSLKRETRAMPKISNWTRLSPASLLPYAATRNRANPKF